MKKYLYIKLFIIILMIWIWSFFYGSIPDIIPHHWDYKWIADAYWPKIYTMIWLPALCILMLGLFYLIPKIDPNKERYTEFQDYWEKIQITIISFMTYIYFVIIYVILNPKAWINFFIFLWIWILFMILGCNLGKIRKNYFVWIRTPWTLANEEVWNKTQKFGGKLFFVCWALTFIDAFLNIFLVRFFFFMMIIVILWSFIYSYLEFRKIKNVK